MESRGNSTIGFLFVALLMFWLACARPPQADSKANDSPVPTDFRLAISEGGGIAGIWQGYIIHADGKIYRWRGRIAGADSQLVGRLSRETLQAIWHRIQSENLFSIQLQKPGNLTRKMAITANQRTHRLSWPSGGAAIPSQTSAQNVYDFCMEHIQSAEQSR